MASPDTELADAAVEELRESGSEVTALARFHWTCPECDADVEEDHDPQGEVVECDACCALAYVGSVL